MAFEFRSLRRRSTRIRATAEGAEYKRIGPVKEDTPMRLIQGKLPDSLQEVRFANSLDKFNLRYKYQVSVNGGARMRGGQIVDFVVFNPFPVACELQGHYWHSGQHGTDEQLKLHFLEVIFKRVEEFWEHELLTQELTDQAVRDKLL